LTATIHLIRHAESLWNVERRYQGQGDSGLTELGRAQAAALATALPVLVPHADLLIASDLPRAFDTAVPTAAALGLEIETDTRLRELDMGTWSGRLISEMAQEEPALVAAFAAGQDVRRGGGEVFAEMRKRVAAAIDDLFARALDLAADPVVLAFTHGGPIRMAVAELFGTPSPGTEFVSGLLNCSVTTIQQAGGARKLVRFNVPGASQKETRA
jgi:probable phosphoglycerate mutase